MGNHEVVADGDAEHGWPTRLNDTGVCDKGRLGASDAASIRAK
jgi:hypothetical protein